MSLQLSTLGFSLSSPIHNRITINPLAMSCNKKNSVRNKKDGVENTRLPLQLDCRRQALRQVFTSCSKLSGEEDVSLEDDDDLKRKFVDVYSVLKSEVLNDLAFEWTDDSRQWVQQMLDYNVPRGKQGRGFTVVNSYNLLKEGEELSKDEVFNASVLGWCIEWLEGASLIFDDFTDSSLTRRDQPCWFRVPKVGNIAINDAVLLMAHVPRILKKHFREKPYYVELQDLFNEVVFQTTSGQMLDLITPGEEMDLSNYTMDNYRRISQYKASYFACYLPVACALLLAGEDLEKHVNMKVVLIEMGIYFQIVNDYLDCFGNLEKTGKIGTDIEDFKCSWLIVKALELANEEQKKILHDHYGKANPSDVAKVKAVYNDINLPEVYAECESELYDKITSCVKSHPNKTLHGIWASFESYRQLFKMHAS